MSDLNLTINKDIVYKRDQENARALAERINKYAKTTAIQTRKLLWRSEPATYNQYTSCLIYRYEKLEDMSKNLQLLTLARLVQYCQKQGRSLRNHLLGSLVSEQS